MSSHPLAADAARRPGPNAVPGFVERPGSLDLSSRTARALALLSTVCLGLVLPALMVVANKSAPAILGVAALSANAAVIAAGGVTLLRRRYAALLGHPAAVLAMLVLALFVVSFAWTIDTGFTRRGLVEGVPELVFALAATAAWPLVAGRGAWKWLVAGLFAAALLIVFEKAAGMPLHALARARGEAWDLKRSAIPPVLLFWPAAAGCLARGRPALAAALLAAVVLGIVFSHSGAPGFGLAAGLAVAALALLAPRVATGAVGAILLALLVAGPFTGTLASRFLPPAAQGALREEHAAHRIQIWTAFETRVHDRPLLGHGFDTSFRVSQAPRPGGASPASDNGEMVDNHPHNVMLQFWVELGALGALAAALCFGVTLRSLGRLPRRRMAPRLGLLACVVAIGLVGLSAWQPWWIASIAASLLWFARLDAAEPG